MRTLVVVVGMLAVILAAGGSFVVRAQETGSATLDGRCAPESVPAGVDTLVSCIFTARNTGAMPLAHAVLQFQPGQGALPDDYYFLASARKGAPDAPVAENQLDYAFGDLAPGATATLAIEVIVRSSQGYEVDAVLRDVAGHQYARLGVGSGVIPAEPARLVVSLAVQRDGSGQPTSVFDLAVRNGTGAAVNGAKLWLFYGESAALSPADAWQINLGGSAIRTTGVIEPSQTIHDTLTFVSNGAPCAYVHPAVLVFGAAGTKETTAAAIGKGGASLGACGGRGGGDAQALGLPSSGTGSGAGGDGLGMPAPVFGLALGLLLVAAGYSVRRLR